MDKKKKVPKKDHKKKSFEQMVNGRRFKNHPFGVLIGAAKSAVRQAP